MIENEIKELLVELKNGQQNMQKQINKLEKQQQSTEVNLTNKINEATERIEKLEKQQQSIEVNLTNKINKATERIEKLEKQQQSTLNKIDEVSLTVARIEAVHEEKLEILLDVVTEHIKKFDSVNERVEKCETRLDSHDNKFYILKSAVQSC